MAVELDARSLDDLLPIVERWTGFHRDAIRPDALRRVVRSLLAVACPEQLIARALERDPAIVSALAEGVAVGETYFFRQVEHFEHLSHAVRDGRLAFGARTLRAWSAGCSTGEEAYSLAATLTSAAGLTDVQVIGTDLLDRNVRVAERGVYGGWSFRGQSPLLYPIAGDRQRPLAEADAIEVADQLRSRTAFHVANVLDPQPSFAGRFDVIFCRNVLIYFSVDAARATLANLVDALAPGGLLYLGPMDAAASPPELVEVGPPGLNIYARAPRKPSRPPAVRRPAETPCPVGAPRSSPARAAAPPIVAGTVRTPPVAERSPVRTGEAIAFHLRALELIEAGDLVVAAALLERLYATAPAYLPGVLELALMRDRTGRRTEAARLMRELLRRAEQLPSSSIVRGPEDVAVAYLVASALAYLGPEGGRT